MVNFIWNFDNGKIDYACDPMLIPEPMIIIWHYCKK